MNQNGLNEIEKLEFLILSRYNQLNNLDDLIPTTIKTVYIEIITNLYHWIKLERHFYYSQPPPPNKSFLNWYESRLFSIKKIYNDLKILPLVNLFQIIIKLKLLKNQLSIIISTINSNNNILINFYNKFICLELLLLIKQ